MTSRGYQAPYAPSVDRELRLSSASGLAKWAITTPDLHPQHRTLVAKQALWLATSCDGKLTPRFRTRAAMTYDGPHYWSVLQHEHVVPLRVLVDEMIERPDEIDAIVRGAPACLVTREEHQRLTPLDRTHRGWDRYRAASVEVIDALTGEVFLASSTSAAAPIAPSPNQLPVRPLAARTDPRRRAGQNARAASGRYADFWALLQTQLADRHSEWRAGAVQSNYQRHPGPAPKCQFQFDFASQGLRHQLLFTASSREANEARLMDLAAVEEQLVEAYGGELSFETLPGRTQCRVADYLLGATVEDTTRWDEYIEWFLSSGKRLREALEAVGFGALGSNAK
jgi:hypothetical protein